MSIVVVFVLVFGICHAYVIIPIIEIHIHITFVVIRLDSIQHYNDIDTAMQNCFKSCKECFVMFSIVTCYVLYTGDVSTYMAFRIKFFAVFGYL